MERMTKEQIAEAKRQQQEYDRLDREIVKTEFLLLKARIELLQEGRRCRKK